MTIGIILGSVYHEDRPLDRELAEATVTTPEGDVVVHRVVGRDAVILFRHGRPHRWLPHQIPFRAHTSALVRLGVSSLVVTSSVGVLDASVLHEPLLVDDLIMLENRLPDGSTCTMFLHAVPDHGHLILDEGLCSRARAEHLETIARSVGSRIAGRVVLGYAQGPRTKTSAENRAWRLLGAHVNSMTVGPELVLANELGVPTIGLVIGHKYSVPGVPIEPGDGIKHILDTGRERFDRLLRRLVDDLRPVPFENRLYRFGHDAGGHRVLVGGHTEVRARSAFPADRSTRCFGCATATTASSSNAPRPTWPPRRRSRCHPGGSCSRRAVYASSHRRARSPANANATTRSVSACNPSPTATSNAVMGWTCDHAIAAA